MSENLDLVRSVLAASERGEFLQAAEWAHPDIEWVIAEGPTAGTWMGVAGMAESVRGMLGAWEELRIETQGVRALDGERVLALYRYRGRGKTSGLPISDAGANGATLFHVRDGKVTRMVVYYDRDRALADLGLES